MKGHTREKLQATDTPADDRPGSWAQAALDFMRFDGTALRLHRGLLVEGGESSTLGRPEAGS